MNEAELSKMIEALKQENEARMKALEAKLEAKDKEIALIRASKGGGFKRGSCNAKAASYIARNNLGDYESASEAPRISLQALIRAIILEDAEKHKEDEAFEVQPATACHQLRSHYKKMGWEVQEEE